MSVAAAGGGDNNWKGKSHADDDQSPLSSSSTDDEDLGDATRKRKLTSSPRAGLSKCYPGASKSFLDLDLTTIGSTDVKVLEDVRHHANKKRRLRVAAEEDRKLLNEDADQAADTDEVTVDAEDNNSLEAENGN